MRSLFLCLLLSGTLNAEVHLKLRRVTSKTSSQQDGSRHHVTRHVNSMRSGRGVVNEGFFDETYQVDVNVGTPPQHFNLTLDTYRVESFLFAIDFKAYGCSSYISNATRRLFAPSASSTHAVVPIPGGFAGFNLVAPYTTSLCKFGNGYVFASSYHTDTFQIGDLSAQDTAFVLAYNIGAPLCDDWPSDGILGLALWGTQDTSVPAAVIELLRSTKQWIASMYLTRPTKTSQLTEHGGALVFGGKDTQNCDSAYSQWINLYIPGVTEDYSWGFSFDSFSMGSYVTSAQTAQLQSQTTFIYAPTKVFNKIVRLAGAEYDFHTDRYTVKCTKAKSLPAMVFTFGSFKYSVPATDYVRMIGSDYARNDGVCTLAVMDAGAVFMKCCDWGSARRSTSNTATYSTTSTRESLSPKL